VGDPGASPSTRRGELLEAAYRYVLAHGLAEMSLRPLAAAVGSSPRVLLYLFGSKDGLVRALLGRARSDELRLLARARELGAADGGAAGPAPVVELVWGWLAAGEHRALLTLWLEGYARSLTDPAGVWGGFARSTVADWLDVLRSAQPEGERDTPAALAERTAALAILRGCLLDLLATGDTARTTAALRRQLATLGPGSAGHR
jgi:AcrR family transcriptional regulator